MKKRIIYAGLFFLLSTVGLTFASEETSSSQEESSETESSSEFSKSKVSEGKKQSKLSESSKIMIQKLKESSLIDSPSETQVVIPKSKEAKKIIFGKKGSCKIAFKVFSDINVYHEEKTKINSTNELIRSLDEHAGANKENIPIIIGVDECRVIEEQGIFKQNRAVGETLQEIFAKIGTIDHEKIRTIFSDIGSKLGTLDFVYYKKSKKQQLCHPDSHLGNFIYNEKHKTLYWIDNLGLRCTALGRNPNEFLLRYFFIKREIRETIFSLVGSIEQLLADYDYDINDKVELIEKYLLAVKSMYIGYINALPPEIKQEGKNNYRLFLYSHIFEEYGENIIGGTLRDKPQNEDGDDGEFFQSGDEEKHYEDTIIEMISWLNGQLEMLSLNEINEEYYTL